MRFASGGHSHEERPFQEERIPSSVVPQVRPRNKNYAIQLCFMNLQLQFAKPIGILIQQAIHCPRIPPHLLYAVLCPKTAISLEISPLWPENRLIRLNQLSPVGLFERHV